MQSLLDKLKSFSSKYRVVFKDEYVNIMMNLIEQDYNGCTHTCNLCGVVCDKQKDHIGKCYSKNHKYPALLGYVLKYTDKLIVHYNCNGIYAHGYRINDMSFEEAVCQTWEVEKADPASIELSQNAFYQWLIVKYKKDLLQKYDLGGWHPQDPLQMWG